MSRASFWCAAIAAGLALLGPPALAEPFTGLAVAAGIVALVSWRLALRRAAQAEPDEALPEAQPVAAASLIDSAARVADACAAAASADAALFAVAAVLKGELGAHAVPVYRVRAIDAHHATLVAARAGALGDSTVQRLVRLDEGALGRAVGTRRVSGALGQAWAVPVEREGRCAAVLLLDGLALQADEAALASLLELTRRQLCARAARSEPPPLQTNLQVQAAAREDHRAFSDMLDESLFVSNPQRSHFEFLAGSAFELWGMTPEQHAQRTDVFLDNVLPEDLPLLAARRAAELRGEDTDVEVRIRHPQRGLRWLRSRTHTRAQPDGSQRVYGRVCDITEERLRQQVLERARDAAQAASRAKSQVLATMSHELRTPMNGMIGMTELLLATALDDTQRRYAQAALGSGEALLASIDDILDFSKIEAGQVELVTADFGLHEALAAVLDRQAQRAHDKGLALRLVEAPGLPATLRGDALRLRQVLGHLLANAIAFTERGEVVVEVCPGAAPATLEFSVRDTGAGIPAEALPRVFEAYTQVQGGAARRHGGMGLGLALSRHLVALMGGRIDVHSSPGQGSEFRFALPQLAAASAVPMASTAARAAGSGAAADTTAPLRMLGGRVLVVEDNAVNQEVIGQMLRACGCEVGLASSAAEGLRALCEAHFDLVLMDIQMPGMDGVEALGWFRRGPGARWPFVTPPHTPVIAVTADVAAGDEDRFFELGFDDCLSKPLRLHLLHAMLNQRLRPQAPLEPGDAPPPGAAPPAAAGLFDAGVLATLRALDPTGSNQLMGRVTKAFETSSARLLAELKEARAAGNMEVIYRVVHTFKSSAANIGAMQLSQHCAELENQLRQHRTDDLDAKLQVMVGQIEIVLKALSQLTDARP